MFPRLDLGPPKLLFKEYLEEKRQGSETGHSPPSSAEVKSSGALLQLLQYAFMTMSNYIFKYRDVFTLP
jgi:hypothetical protein